MAPLLLVAALSAHAASPDDVASTVAAYNTSAVHPLPTLDPGRLQDLVDGDVVRVLDKNDDPTKPSAAVGMLLTDVGLGPLWIAAQDPHTVVDPDLTEAIVEQRGPDSAVWYGYWDLPRPVKDRQWVVESSNNHPLATATDGRCWEHLWRRVDGGLAMARPMIEAGQVGDITVDQVDSAIVTPVNHGSWSFCTLPDGKILLAYQATSVVGGAIPDWLVNQLVMARLEGVLRGLEERARTWAPAHYTADHAPVPGGDGAPVPPLD